MSSWVQHDNLAEGLRWLLEQSGQDAIELASLLWPYWYQRGHYREARDAFEQVLASHHDVPLSARAQALSGAGEVRFCNATMQWPRPTCDTGWS